MVAYLSSERTVLLIPPQSRPLVLINAHELVLFCWGL